MNGRKFRKYHNEFLIILNESGYRAEDFLFHAKPYVDGFYKIINKFNSVAKINPKKKLLDVGCGSGFTSYILSKASKVEVKAIDIYDKGEEIQYVFKEKGKTEQRKLWSNIEKNCPNLDFSFYDGVHIPFEDKYFDYVFLHAVVEHIPNNISDDVIRDIDRVLKPGGMVIVARTPNKYSITEHLIRSHEVLYTKKELIDLFSSFSKPIFYTKTDFLPEIFPGRLQNLANYLSPMFNLVENIVPFTPLAYFSHHHFVILKKF